jgi:hypothetical protein
LQKAHGDSLTSSHQVLSHKNLQVVYFGLGSAFGVTRINSGGHYTRLPYLFTPSWNAKQWVFILFLNFACMAMWVVPAALLLLAVSEKEAESLWLKTHNDLPKSPAEQEQFVSQV